MSSYQPPPPPPGMAYAPPPPPASYPPAKSGKSWIPWAIGGCGCLLLLIVGFGLTLFMGVKAMTAGPEEVATSFLAAAGRGDSAAAHAYFSGPLKEAQGYDEFAAKVSANPHAFQVASTSYRNRSIDMEGASLEGTATLTNGAEVPISFKFVKEGEEWKLIAYNIGN